MKEAAPVLNCGYEDTISIFPLTAFPEARETESQSADKYQPHDNHGNNCACIHVLLTSFGCPGFDSLKHKTQYQGYYKYYPDNMRAVQYS